MIIAPMMAMLSTVQAPKWGFNRASIPNAFMSKSEDVSNGSLRDS